MHRTVGDLLKQKQFSPAARIQHFQPVEYALNRLSVTGQRALLVMNDLNLIGIFSAQDFVRSVKSKNLRELLSEPISELMSHPVVYVTTDYRLDECLAVMSDRQISHLPVMSDGQIVALLDMRDIMEILIRDRDFMIGELVKYVTGSFYTEPKQIYASF